MTLHPMSTFDPAKPCQLHDQLNNTTFEWRPEWADDYRKHATGGFGPGIISWDGLLLDGWTEIDETSVD
jgi:hypothetical protein